MDAITLIGKCRELGATFIPLNGRLKVQAPNALPDKIINELKEAKSEILAELKRQVTAETECWLLEEWRRISLPEWRRILQEAVEARNPSREEYARWMLKEILEDQEYVENNK